MGIEEVHPGEEGLGWILALREPVHRHVDRQLAREVLFGEGDLREALAKARVVVPEVVGRDDGEGVVTGA
jgi:hypothetical protein